VEILQAIVNKDASKAKKLMHSHLQSVLASLDLNDD
jgi:DNA-binding GntR family transcriptional regulator